MNDPFWLVQAALDAFELHLAGPPVDLSPLEEICPVTFEPLRRLGLAGLCVATEPASRVRPAKVAVDQDFDRRMRRIVYAHEAAHGIIGHSGAMALDELDPWFKGRIEREAWQGAAMLLIPRLFPRGCDVTRESIIRDCDIPTWLIDRLPPGWF
jgi:hypothetical protein